MGAFSGNRGQHASVRPLYKQEPRGEVARAIAFRTLLGLTSNLPQAFTLAVEELCALKRLALGYVRPDRLLKKG